MDELAKLDIGLPAESSRGNFNISSRQIETIFKSSGIDRRIVTDVRKSQTEIAQAYYRYLSTYNKYALAEQTVAARQQEVDLSDSDSERQRAAADLAQAKNDLDSTKDDMRSAEIELAVVSSPSAARTVISRVAGIAPSVESLAQACSQNNNHAAINHSNRIANVFESVFRHHFDTSDQKKPVEHKTDDEKINKVSQDKIAARHKIDNDDLAPAPVAKKNEHVASDDIASNDQPIIAKHDTTTGSAVSFELNGIDIKPRKSVLSVAVRNRSEETFELNPDTIFIAEGGRKLAAADIRADFDITSIQPDHEVKGTITVFGQPWNERLHVYLNDGNKTIQLKR